MEKDDILRKLSEGAKHNESFAANREQTDIIYLKLLAGTTTDLYFENILVTNEPFTYVEGESLEWEKKYNNKYIDVITFSNGDQENRVVFKYRKPRNNSLIMDIRNMIELDEEDNLDIYFEELDDAVKLVARKPSLVTIGRRSGQFGEYYLA